MSTGRGDANEGEQCLLAGGYMPAHPLFEFLMMYLPLFCNDMNV